MKIPLIILLLSCNSLFSQVTKIWEHELVLPNSGNIANSSIAVNGAKLIDSLLYIFSTERIDNNQNTQWKNILFNFNINSETYVSREISNVDPSLCSISQGLFLASIGKTVDGTFFYPNKGFNLCLVDDSLDNSISNNVYSSLFKIMGDSVAIYDTIMNFRTNHGIVFKDSIIAYLSRLGMDYNLNVIKNNQKYSVRLSLPGLHYGGEIEPTSYMQFKYELAVIDNKTIYLILREPTNQVFSVYKHDLFTPSVELFYSTAQNPTRVSDISLISHKDVNYYFFYRVYLNEENEVKSMTLNNLVFSENSVYSNELFNMKGSLDCVVVNSNTTLDTDNETIFALQSRATRKIFLLRLDSQGQLINVDSSFTNLNLSTWLYCYQTINFNTVVLASKQILNQRTIVLEMHNSDFTGKFTYEEPLYNNGFFHAEYYYKNDSLFLFTIKTITTQAEIPYYFNKIILEKYYINDLILNNPSLPIKSQTFYIKPNPGKDFLTVSSTTSGYSYSLLIHDNLGRLIATQKDIIGDQHFETSHWPAGIYFVTVTNTNSVQTLKWIKQ